MILAQIILFGFFFLSELIQNHCCVPLTRSLPPPFFQTQASVRISLSSSAPPQHCGTADVFPTSPTKTSHSATNVRAFHIRHAGVISPATHYAFPNVHIATVCPPRSSTFTSTLHDLSPPRRPPSCNFGPSFPSAPFCHR